MSAVLTAAPATKRRIFINGRFLSQEITGSQRYALELVKALDRRLAAENAAEDWTLLAPRNTRHDLHLERIGTRRIGRLTGHAWEQFELPFEARGGLLLGLCNTGPLAHPNQVVTIHDACVFAVPEAHSWKFRAWHQLVRSRVGRRAATVLTDSSFSRFDVSARCRIPAENIEVVPLGVDHIGVIESNPDTLARLGLKGEFVLTVGTLNPYKNFRTALKAAQILADGGSPIPFVVAGGANPQVFESLGVRWPSNARYLGRVSDSTLKALYEAAACFVFPSLYEGFGLPPLEAMACGCPVAASRAASIPEVCGDAAVYFDPLDPGDAARAVEKIVSDRALRERLSEKGRTRAAGFTWDLCAERSLAVIREALV